MHRITIIDDYNGEKFTYSVERPEDDGMTVEEYVDEFKQFLGGAGFSDCQRERIVLLDIGEKVITPNGEIFDPIEGIRKKLELY